MNVVDLFPVPPVSGPPEPELPTASLTEHQRSVLKYICRQPAMRDGWRQMQDTVFEVMLEYLRPDLTELDHVEKRVRLTPDGLIVARYLL